VLKTLELVHFARVGRIYIPFDSKCQLFLQFASFAPKISDWLWFCSHWFSENDIWYLVPHALYSRKSISIRLSCYWTPVIHRVSILKKTWKNKKGSFLWNTVYKYYYCYYNVRCYVCTAFIWAFVEGIRLLVRAWRQTTQLVTTGPPTLQAIDRVHGKPATCALQPRQRFAQSLGHLRRLWE